MSRDLPTENAGTRYLFPTARRPPLETGASQLFAASAGHGSATSTVDKSVVPREPVVAFGMNFMHGRVILLTVAEWSSSGVLSGGDKHATPQEPKHGRLKQRLSIDRHPIVRPTTDVRLAVGARVGQPGGGTEFFPPQCRRSLYR